MERFWDALIPADDEPTEITASPNRASIQQLEGLLPTLLFVDEADVLRDEGEAYAAKLRMAGVPITTVRYDGVVHDFMLLNAMSEARPRARPSPRPPPTCATRSAPRERHSECRGGRRPLLAGAGAPGCAQAEGMLAVQTSGSALGRCSDRAKDPDVDLGLQLSLTRIGARRTSLRCCADARRAALLRPPPNRNSRGRARPAR